MGYSERFCQLCGLSFNIGRIRRPDEPFEAAWDRWRSGVVETSEETAVIRCESDDCSNITRTLPEHIYHDGSIGSPKEVSEHLAGPSCDFIEGYSGHRISVQEMKECTWVQCLLSKDEDWMPEADDEDYELESDSWVTGISQGPADEFEIHGLTPKRHNVTDAYICNCSEPDPEWATPMHPACFEMFKRMSAERFGKVAIDELRSLWLENTEFHLRFHGFKEHCSDLELVTEQSYQCVPGTEYLAANPLRIPALYDLIQSCVVGESVRGDVVFEAYGRDSSMSDPFAKLSPELKLILLQELDRQDVANLRFVSRSFEQIPQSYFRRLVLDEMPWVRWDVESLPPKKTDWHKLWCRLSAADGGPEHDKVDRRWFNSTDLRQYEEAFAGLTQEQQEQVGEPRSSKSGFMIFTSEQRATMAAMLKEHWLAARQWPASSEIKGLRNRRRIWGDILQFLDAISDMYG